MNCHLCGCNYGSGPDWARGVCDKCKADTDTSPTIHDPVDKLESELEQMRQSRQ